MLVCARLDSLSNLAFQGRSQKDNFIRLLLHHSGHREDILHISLPEFYEYLDFQSYMLPASIAKDGRLHVHPRNDDSYLTFLWNSGIPLTRRHIGSLLRSFLHAIRRNYRVFPNQKLALRSIDTQDSVVDLLSATLEKRQKTLSVDMSGVGSSLANLVKEFSLGSVLYREYRCGIIHQFGVTVRQTDFYSKPDIYYATFYNKAGVASPRLRVQFPAGFLLTTLCNCLESYKSRLLHTKRLPSDIYGEICDVANELRYLDLKSIEEGRDVRIAITPGNGS